MSAPWSHISLVGVGLLGGSIGLAARQRGLAARVTGFVRRAPAVAECEQTGAVDKADTDLWRAVEGADLVILCTPIAQMAGLMTKMLPALKKGTIVTDVGSVKGSVVPTSNRWPRRVACISSAHIRWRARRRWASVRRARISSSARCAW